MILVPFLTLLHLFAFVCPEIVTAFIIQRHGDRMPYHQIQSLPPFENIGQLVQKGANRLEHLGKQIKERYNETLLSDLEYEDQEYAFYATYSERAKMSAQAFARGLFPPGTGPVDPETGEPIFNQLQQLVPIDSCLGDKEYMLLGATACPKGMRIINTRQNNHANRLIYKPNKDLISKLATQTKNSVNGLEILDVIDSLLSLHALGLDLPQGMTENDLEKYKKLFDETFLYYFPTSDPDLCNASLGMFANYLYTSLDKKPSQRLKLHYFNGHDYSLVPMLGCLGVNLTENVGYASMVVIEIHKRTNGPTDVDGLDLEFYHALHPSDTEPLKLERFYPKQCPAEICNMRSFIVNFPHARDSSPSEWFYSKCGFVTPLNNVWFLVGTILAASLLAVGAIAFLASVLYCLHNLYRRKTDWKIN
ncbi:putative histidine phosphatase family protein [Blattamonas nauphoetae]|uniref:Histidine phosphatase family protein n=1 Tax=Blattamonas nauphoetae TaxID=2049346 RepID=A0ABQ9YK82_9EUKA|nr:putative histidine phosphatase family protein [Blattamonas nauphoetae]